MVLLLFSCSPEENITTTTPPENLPFTTKSLSLKDAPEVASFIKEIIGDISPKSKTKKLANSSVSATFDIEKIVETTDSINNKNYNIRFVFKDTPENVFYNLIIDFLSTGKKRAFVEKRTCAIENYPLYRNSFYNSSNFKGTIELFSYTAFFGKSAIASTAKTTEDIPCPQKFYPNGDPIPSVSSFVGGGVSTSSGGATAYYGSNGSVTWPATGGFGLYVYSSGGSYGSSGGGFGTGFGTTIGTIGTAIGNAWSDITKWIGSLFPTTCTTCPPSQRVATDPCPTIVPEGYAGFISEPEKLAVLRSILPLSLPQWQYLHGKDEFMDLLLKFKYSNTDTAKTNEISLWAIDFGRNGTSRDSFFAAEVVTQITNNPTLFKTIIPFLIEKNIDDTNLDPCSKGVFQQVKNTTNNDFAKVLAKLDANRSVYNTTMISAVAPSGAPAQTIRTSAYNYTIYISTDYNGKTKLFIASLQLHELVHAFFFSLIDDCYLQNNCQLLATFPELWEYYVSVYDNQYPSNPLSHHEQIANNYVNAISSALQEYQPGLPQQVYDDLAWSGLEETSIFNSLYPLGSENRQRILNRKAAEQTGHPVNAGGNTQINVGQPCN